MSISPKKFLLVFLISVYSFLQAQDTFSIVVVDTNTFEIGSAGASCIDGSIIISDIIPGVGAIHTQAYWNLVNQNNAHNWLEQGYTPQEIIDLLVNNDAQIKVGQSVVVFGVGGVGINIIQAASLVSATPIVGVDLIEHKLEMGKKFGLTHTVVGGKEYVNDVIIDIVGPNGADVVIETTGNSRIIEQAYELTHPDGKTILVGVPNKGDNISIYSLPLHFNKVLTGSHGGGAVPDLEIPRYIRLMESGNMTLDGLITHEFELDEINDALDLFRSGEAGRIIVKMNR